MLIATGFLALTSKPRAQNNPDYRMDLVADQIDVTSRALLGLTVMCARCHDHKFDPISTKEYYAPGRHLRQHRHARRQRAAKGARRQGRSQGRAAHAQRQATTPWACRTARRPIAPICIRGESTKRGEMVPRRLPDRRQPRSRLPRSIVRTAAGSSWPQWLTRPENPLTARVAVNRVWLHLFGRALVKSPDNFGSLGEQPSHPELLDHLAARFMDDGWSLKKLIRAIVLSRTYRMASTFESAHYRTDPDNVLLWRMQHAPPGGRADPRCHPGGQRQAGPETARPLIGRGFGQGQTTGLRHPRGQRTAASTWASSAAIRCRRCWRYSTWPAPTWWSPSGT